MLIATSAAWLGRPHAKLPAQLENVPSHNRVYRASLLQSQNEWKVRLETADHEPVSGATLVMQPWMPEAPSVNAQRPRVTEAGDGVYRVDGLRLDRPGWWNMKLTVTHAGLTDSLAFNIVMP
jgi:hypothetical protein